MKTIPLSDVIVSPNRQRRTFAADKMAEFADNIARTQLQNAIVLRRVERTYENVKIKIPGSIDASKLLEASAKVLQPAFDYVLVSGERRLRAVTDLADQGIPIRYDGVQVPLGSIPYTDFADLDPLAAEEAELDENIHREDLSFQDLAAAVARLHSLRTRQAAAAQLPPPTTADIAIEVRGSSEGIHQETTRRQLIVANHLNDPIVKEAKTLDEAWKGLKRAEAAEKSRQLGESVGRVFSADLHVCRNEDSLSWLAACPAESFDVILTDPPYGMGADEFGDSGGMAAGAHGYVDSHENFTKILLEARLHFFRIAKPQAHLYWFCDIDNFWQSRLTFMESGWTVFRTPLIWYKRNGTRAPWPQSGPWRKYETILYAKKGDRPALKLAPDVLDYPPDGNLGHAAQKPVALFEELLRRSCNPGDTVIDPFAGTGTIFAAAHALKCRATGIEIDQASYGIAVKRIEGLKAQLELLV